jgi:imidazoleglycerol-phosphate dehydratase
MSTSPRLGGCRRTTRETEITLSLDLDGGECRLTVPGGFFVHMLDAMTTHGRLGVDLQATGDTHIDLHHTVEDVGIAFGEALREALGDRRGVERFGSAYVPLDEALSRAVVDLSGRGFFVWSVPTGLESSWVTPDFPLTLVADFFQALADRARLTLHLDVLAGRNPHHVAESAFKAVGVALSRAVALRGRGGEQVPSTKGSLDA